VRAVFQEETMTDEPVPAWERRLSGKAKVRRASIIVGAVLVALVVLAASSGVFATLRQRFDAAANPTPAGTPVPWIIPPLLPSKTAAGLAISGWQNIPVPEGGRSQIDFTPFPENPAALFACAAIRNIPGQGPLAGPVKLWRTYDSGQQWQLLSLPKLTADTCIVRIASRVAGRILLLTHSTSASGGCLSPSVLLSEDNGDRWLTLSPPHPGPSGAGVARCDAWASGSYIYWYEADACATSNGTPCDEILRSKDAGKSWQQADNGLSSGYFFPVWSNEDDGRTLLAGYLSAQAATASTPVTALWASYDAGDHWLPLPNFPHSALTNTFVSLDPSLAASAPENVIYRQLIGPTATNLDNVAELSVQTGQARPDWMTLPPLPVPGADAHHDGIATIVGVAGKGELLVLGPNPRTGTATARSSQAQVTPPPPDRLWGWNPESRRWEAATSSLPVIPEEATISWGPDASSTTGAWVWLISPSASGTDLMRAYVP
jgi:hypothetical protein